MIKPGQGRFQRDDKKNIVSVTQYNTDGTTTVYTPYEWANKQMTDEEIRQVQRDRKWAIPNIPDKTMTISIDKESPTSRNRGATFSSNLLDSIAVNAKRADLPFKTALGMVSQESTFG